MPEEFADARDRFVGDYPPAQAGCTENKRWEAFKNAQQAAYAALKNCLCSNQYGLCAFCESTLGTNNYQIEHFIPKLTTSPRHDYTLDFSNLLMSCKGYEHLCKENHSCGNKKGKINPEGSILNPYDLPKFPLIAVKIDSSGLTFVPDKKACAKAKIRPGLVQTTLDCLGLNNPNLRRRRLALWESLKDEIDKIADDDNREHEIRLLAEDHLLPKREGGMLHKEQFYTTRLLCFSQEIHDFCI